MGYFYEWYDSSNLKFIGNGNPIVNPTISKTYMVVASDGCTVPADTDYVYVKVRAPLKINFTRDTTICYGNSVRLFADASGGDSLAYTFIWSHGFSNGTTYDVTPTQTTTYKVKIIDNCTLKADSAQTTVRVLPPLDVILDEDTLLCYRQPFKVKAKAFGGNMNYNYQWFDPISGVQLPETSAVFSFVAERDTAFKVVLSDGCTVFPDSDFIFVKVRKPLALGITKALKICEGQSFKFYAKYSGGDTAGYRFQWWTDADPTLISSMDRFTV